MTFETAILICSTWMILGAMMAVVFLYAAHNGLFRITVQVAAAPAPQVVLRQSAGAVFSGPRRDFGTAGGAT